MTAIPRDAQQMFVDFDEQMAASDDGAASRLTEYQDMIENTLKPLVVRRRAEYDAAVAEEVEWRALLAQVDALQAHRARHAADGKPLKMLADVGAGYRQHARVDDVSKISVDIGLGIYVELSLAEATVFASKKAEVQARVVQGAKDELLRLTADLAVATAAVKSLGSS